MDVNRWAGLLIGLLVGAYWARVVKLVFKTRRLTGKAANFLPPEPLGRALRIVWYPTVVAWMIVPLLVALVPRPPRSLQPLIRQPIVTCIALAVAVAALWATLVCWRRMGKSWRMGIDPAERTQLIISGPYAYVRHPIYSLSSVLMVASVLAVPTPAMLVVGLIHLLFLQWEARREEQYLVQTHGDAYGDYLRHVGRFMPRSLSPYQSQR
jgi:protein-S-isoprenylcysteine O-methyltransferase Ste14